MLNEHDRNRVKIALLLLAGKDDHRQHVESCIVCGGLFDLLCQEFDMQELIEKDSGD